MAGEHLTKPPYGYKVDPNDKKKWIVGILERMDYYGHTVNFKSYSKSHKLKKRISAPKEQQAICRNTPKAIVEEAEKGMKRKRREVEQARKRIAELERIFNRKRRHSP